MRRVKTNETNCATVGDEGSVLNRWKTKIHRKKSKMSEEIAPLKIVLVFKLYQDVLCNQLYTMDN